MENNKYIFFLSLFIYLSKKKSFHVLYQCKSNKGEIYDRTYQMFIEFKC